MFITNQNIYTYALNNPVRYTDPSGLIVPALLACAADPACVELAAAATIFAGDAAYQLYNQGSVNWGDAFATASMAFGSGVPTPAKAAATFPKCPPIALSKSRFGHTFTTHGQDATNFLINRAAGSGKPVGQFLDDQAAARFIENNIDNLNNGAISVPVPDNLPVRVIMPDGSYAPASTIRLVPGGNGVKTAYPEP